VRYDALARQMQLMKSMGVNALRTAHNPPAPRADRGLRAAGHRDDGRGVRLAGTPGRCPTTTTCTSNQWSDSDIKEMSTPRRTRPAVVLWSLGNETPDTGSSRGPGIAKQLVADIKSIDNQPSRGDGLGQVPQRARHRVAPRT